MFNDLTVVYVKEQCEYLHSNVLEASVKMGLIMSLIIMLYYFINLLKPSGFFTFDKV